MSTLARTGSPLDGWTRAEYDADGRTHDIYRRGTGPGVIVIHEIPGMTPEVIEFADEVVAAGCTVVMPHLFGDPGRKVSAGYAAAIVPQLCVSKEFTTFATGRTSPIAGWLRSLSRSLHDELGGPGVGVVGMCFTGGFALAMMVDDSVAAPVVAQPSTPFAIGRRRSADLALSPKDLAAVKARAAGGCPVLGLRYAGDRATGTRFATLHRELGDAFTAVEFPGSKHATLTAHRQQEGVDAVLAFLRRRLEVDA
ncbi:dienelactone hydrolase family protein [Allobranchiibius sp. GilTou38]|uniref:dienelactone hydrolase family protein n=1 Tax=Allobranchiibius sp. GilTou38 TaxID=2815210 RepID=UPI001AA16F22|nr:dienelactone hydrolase family protein [Allobranchiibius sp. GilTou38]MBO1767257.1 dienelactone hydrolase family protein [Allobranchiibius sp. GilTou38]